MKPIQIAIDSHETGLLYVLCDDGSMWRLKYEAPDADPYELVPKWERIPEIPVTQ